MDPMSDGWNLFYKMELVVSITRCFHRGFEPTMAISFQHPWHATASEALCDQAGESKLIQHFHNP